MSYEYKEMLKAAARDFLAGTLQQDSETEEYLNLGEVEEIYSDISIELDHVYAQAAKADECEAKAKAFDEIKNNLHDAQSSIDRSGNRKEERDYAVAFFNGLVEMDILEVYERTERND